MINHPGRLGGIDGLVITVSILVGWLLAASGSTLLQPGTRSASPPGPDAPSASQAGPLAEFGAAPIAFEPNIGQAPTGALFFAQTARSALSLSPTEVDLAVASGKTIGMRLVDANADADVRGLESEPGTANFYVGNNAEDWHTAIPTFGRVSYSQVYPGIDLNWYGTNDRLEYEFVVGPGVHRPIDSSRTGFGDGNRINRMRSTSASGSDNDD